MEEDVKEVVLEISSYILKLAGISESLEENKKKVLEVIEKRKGLSKVFRTYRETRWRCSIFR